MTYKTFLPVIAILVMLIGCSNNNKDKKPTSENPTSYQEQATADPNVIKVYVDQEGNITVDGKKISLSDLDSSFSKLKAVNGIVYYSRDNGQGEPPQEAMKVMELIVKYSLPVKLFTDKTFSVIVKPN